MLYTGRAHFFARYRIRGVSNIIFYAPPIYGHIYEELIGFLDEAKRADLKTSSVVLFSKYDSIAMANITGDSSARYMSTAERSSFFWHR